MKNPGLEKALAAVQSLRSENGCPWDKEQDHKSLRKYLLEETYEVLEVLDNYDEKNPSSVAHLKEELGDLLFQVLLHAQIASESQKFSLDEVAGDLAEKLIRRHPHVFGGKKLDTAEEVLVEWEKTKSKEKKKESILDSLPPLPALQKSIKIIEKVTKVGFQWPNLEGPMEKLEEELKEFKGELKKLGSSEKITKQSHISEAEKNKIESEMGDLLFSISNIAHFLNINPEDSLRSMLKRFELRFRHVESCAKRDGKILEEMSLDEMDAYWNEAKKLHRV